MRAVAWSKDLAKRVKASEQPIYEQRPGSSPFPPISCNPLVTIIVPSYKQGDLIEETILSILRQDYKSIELIVADGLSNDNTLEVLRQYESDSRTRWISEPDSGPHAAINKGLKLARGELIGVQSSSDTYQPGAIREAVQQFNSDPLLALVGGFVQVIDKEGFATGEIWQLPMDKPVITIDEVLRFKDYPGMQSSFIRADLALAIGGFDEELQSCHTIFYLRYMLEALRIGAHLRRVPKIWGNFRIHPNHRSKRPSVEGLPYGRERNLACRRMAQRYKGYLTREQIRLLHGTGYYSEVHYGVLDGHEILRTVPAFLGYLWLGGHPRKSKKLWFYLVWNMLSNNLIGLIRGLFERRFPSVFEALRSLKHSIYRTRGERSLVAVVPEDSQPHVQVDTRWYLP